MSHGSDFKSLIWGAVLLLLAACVPLIANGYWMSIALTIAMFSVLATSWSLFSGPTHYISLATAAFFGVGGYLVGTGMSDYNMDFWTMVAIAPVVGGKGGGKPGAARGGGKDPAKLDEALGQVATLLQA